MWNSVINVEVLLRLAVAQTKPVDGDKITQTICVRKSVTKRSNKNRSLGAKHFCLKINII